MKKDIKKVEIFTLEQSGYKAQIMKAPRLKGDRIFGLPPGEPIGCIPIKCLPGVPENWLTRSGTYVVPVDCEHGFWFDWRENDQYNTAIISSVKGINPITGLKIDELNMEQYREKCPIHGCDFSHGNFCEECGYNFPYQNYISYPNIPLWQDGFRQSDGSVRQFFFSEEDSRDVASAIIGRKNTVPAFGFAFYRCINDRRPKQDIVSDPTSWKLGSYDSLNTEKIFSSPIHKDSDWSVYYTTSSSGTCSTTRSCSTSSSSSGSSSHTKGLDSGENKISKSETNIIKRVLGGSRQPMSGIPQIRNKEFDAKKSQERFSKDVSIGAGAKIRQQLSLDKTPISEWGESPEAVITLYFVFSEQLEEIIEKGGIKKLACKPEGFLENVQVG